MENSNVVSISRKAGENYELQEGACDCTLLVDGVATKGTLSYSISKSPTWDFSFRAEDKECEWSGGTLVGVYDRVRGIASAEFRIDF